MKKFKHLFFSACIVGATILNFNSVEAVPIASGEHLFIDEVAPEDWFFDNSRNYIFVGYGSPYLPEEKTHFIVRNSIKYGTMADGRLIVKCIFKDFYNFEVVYQPKKADGSHRAIFILRDQLKGGSTGAEVEPVLYPFNGQEIEPFPPLKSNIMPSRVAEMLYFIVTGEKYYGNLNPNNFTDAAAHKYILNPYTPDLYERCKIE